MLRTLGVQALILIVNILTGVLTARLLGPEGRGIYVAVTLWPPLFSALAVAGLNSAVVYRLRRSPHSMGGIASAALLLGAASALATTVIGACLLPLFMAKYGAALVIFAQLCLVNVLVNSMQSLIKQTFAGAGQYWYCNLIHLLPQLFHLLGLLAILPFAALSARAAVVALIISSSAAVLVMLPKFIRVVRPQFRGAFGELLQLVSYMFRAMPTDIVFTLATYSDRLVLLPLLAPHELGLYAVAFSFSRVIQFVQPAIMSVFLSHMSAQSEAENKLLHDRACRVLIACLVPGCALCWFAGEWLLVFAYGAEFAAAMTVFRLLVIEASLGVLSQVTVQLFLARNRPGIVSTIQVIVLCISVAALLTFVPRYGAFGAAICLLGAAAIRWLLLLGALPAVLKVPLPRFYLTRDDFRYVMGRLS